VFYVIAFPAAMLVCRLLYAVRYEGSHRLRKWKGGAILVSNHTAPLDPVMITGAAYPALVYQTLLERTVETPFLGTFIRLLGGVPLPRGPSGIERLLAAAKKALSYRTFLHFYPEGECFIYNQRIEEYKPGAFYLAAKLNIPVIPIVNILTESFFAPPRTTVQFTAPLITRPRMTWVVLPPVYPSFFVRYHENGEPDMNSVRTFAQEVRQLMQEEINRRRAENPRAGTQRYYRGRMPRLKGINA
jgi:1-acyl-sn-glycerol-3-phosphate acyltransferase